MTTFTTAGTRGYTLAKTHLWFSRIVQKSPCWTAGQEYAFFATVLCMINLRFFTSLIMTYFSDCLRYVVRFFNLPLGISGLQKNLSKRKIPKRRYQKINAMRKFQELLQIIFKTQTVEVINACRPAISKHYFFTVFLPYFLLIKLCTYLPLLTT